MLTTLAKTTFETGIDDALAAVDVYTQTTAIDPSDAFMESIDLGEPPPLALLGGEKGIPTAFMSMTALAKSALVDARSLKDGVISQIEDGLSSLNALSSDVRNQVLSVTGEIRSIVKIGQEATNTVNSITNLLGLGSLVKNYANTPFVNHLLDYSGNAEVAFNLINAASKAGLPGAYTQIASKLTGKPAMLVDVTKRLLPKVTELSNSRLFSEIAKGPLGPQVIKLNPNIVSEVSAEYKLPTDSVKSDYLGIAKSLSNSFTLVNPRWEILSSGGSKTTMGSQGCLEPSDDFKKLMHATAQVCNITNQLPTWEEGGENPDDYDIDNSDVIEDRMVLGSVMTDVVALADTRTQKTGTGNNFYPLKVMQVTMSAEEILQQVPYGAGNLFT